MVPRRPSQPEARLIPQPQEEFNALCVTRSMDLHLGTDVARWHEGAARGRQHKEKPTILRKAPLQKVSHGVPFSAATEEGTGLQATRLRGRRLGREGGQQPLGGNRPSVPQSSFAYRICSGLCIFCDRDRVVPACWEIAILPPEHFGNLSEGHKDIGESWCRLDPEKLRQAGPAWAKVNPRLPWATYGDTSKKNS